MVRGAKFKTPSVKKKPGDFKRPKRKVGRKAPAAANVTSVAVASRRINMLEQSVLTEKGEAVTHRHLSLQDLMSNIGHYNAHMRQRALQGLRELAQSHPANVLANVAIVLERFLRTFVDDEAIVREAAVQTWKTLITVMMEGKSLKPFAKLIAMYFCSGLTHLQMGIRQDTLRAISVLLEVAPDLISVDAGLEQLGRLIENFRDLIAAAQTQGIKINNSYDLLNASSGNGSGRSAASKKQQGDNQQTNKASTKKNANTSALTLRFSALTVLHKLLHSIDFSAEELASATKSIQRVVRNVTRMAPVASSQVLLLYATPTLVVGNQSERLRSVGFWQEKSRTLLRPLLDLWLECMESDSIESLSEEFVENMQRIVETATVILSANVDHMAEFPDGVLAKSARKIQEQLLARFPMFPENNFTAGGDAYLARWYGMNVSIAKFACVLLQLPANARAASMKDLDARVNKFVVSTMTKYTASDELRSLSSTHLIIRGLLEVLTSVLAAMPVPEQREELLAEFTQLYVKCSPRSMTFRTCTAFVIDRLADLRRWPSWPLVLQWLKCFGNFLGQLDANHMELGRQCLFTMISVMKQLPTDLAKSGAADSVLNNLEQFFNVNVHDAKTTQFRFDELSASDQLEFVSLVYHLPSYPVGLLRALASCCKSPRVHIDAKSFLMDILHQRSEMLDLAHLVSFLMSGILGRVQDAELTATQKQQHLQLTRHVSSILLTMNLGASLAKILTPALSRQASSLETMDPLDVHTLLLLYGANFASVKPIHRGELPAEMVSDVVRVATSSLLAFGSSMESQTLQLDLLHDLVSTLVLSDDVVRRVLESLLQYASSDVADVLTTKLKALQFLVQSTTLRQWFVQHNALTLQRLDAFDAANASKATEDVTRLVRQVRGDLHLVVVGQTPHQ